MEKRRKYVRRKKDCVEREKKEETNERRVRGQEKFCEEKGEKEGEEKQTDRQNNKRKKGRKELR